MSLQNCCLLLGCLLVTKYDKPADRQKINLMSPKLLFAMYHRQACAQQHEV